MLRMPLTGSLVTQSVAVRYGAASKPGVDTGTGSALSPSVFNAAPVMTTSWHGASLVGTGGIGWAIAAIQASPISSTGRPMPSAWIVGDEASAPTTTGMSYL